MFIIVQLKQNGYMTTFQPPSLPRAYIRCLHT